MKKNNSLLMTMILIIGFFAIVSSCKKEDEMDPPSISFKTGGSYTSDDAALAAGSPVTIGIEAEKSDEEGEDEDVLNHFNISRSLNGGAAATVYDIDVPAANEESYSYDFNTNVSSTAGDTEKYTFTITNRDGLTGQVSLTITAN